MSEHAVEQEGVVAVGQAGILLPTKEETEHVSIQKKVSDTPFDSLPPDLRLLRKLDNWLRMQPEWVVFLSPSRNERKRIAKAIAKAITTIPKD